MRKLKNWSSLDAHPIYVSFSENLDLTLKDTFDVLHLFPPQVKDDPYYVSFNLKFDIDENYPSISFLFSKDGSS